MSVDDILIPGPEIQLEEGCFVISVLIIFHPLHALRLLIDIFKLEVYVQMSKLSF